MIVNKHNHECLMLEEQRLPRSTAPLQPALPSGNGVTNTNSEGSTFLLMSNQGKYGDYIYRVVTLVSLRVRGKALVPAGPGPGPVVQWSWAALVLGQSPLLAIAISLDTQH